MKSKIMRVISVVLALTMVLSTIPVASSADRNVITELETGINIITEESILDTDVPSDVTLVVTKDTITENPITIEGRVVVIGSTMFGQQNSVPMTFKNGGSLFYSGNYESGPAELDLSDIKAISEYRGHTASWPDTATNPDIMLSDDAQLSFWYDELVKGDEETIGLYLDAEAGKTTINMEGIGECCITVGKEAKLDFDEENINTAGTTIINNKSMDTVTAEKLAYLAETHKDVTVNNLVNVTVDSKTEERYIKCGEKFVYTPESGSKINTAVVDSESVEVSDELCFEYSVVKPCSIYLETKAREYNINVTVKNGSNGTVTNYDGTVVYGNPWSASVSAEDGYYYTVTAKDKENNDVAVADSGSAISIESVTKDVDIEVTFLPVKATEIKIINSDTSFYPNGIYNFEAQIIPDAATKTEIEWSVAADGEGELPEGIAIDAQSGQLSIGADVPADTKFLVAVQDKEDSAVKSTKEITVTVGTVENISDYLLFDGEAYSEGKWYNSDVIITLTEAAEAEGCTFVYNTKGDKRPVYATAGGTADIPETTKDLQFRIFKGKPDEALEVIDVAGEYSVLIDRDKPSFTKINVEYDPIGVYDGWGKTATVTLTAIDENSGIKSLEYRPVGEATFTPVAESEENVFTVQFDKDTNENNEFEFVVTDNAGLTDSKIQKINIDRTPPEIKVSYTADSFTSFIEVITLGLINITGNAKFKIEAADAGCGVKDVKFAIVTAETAENPEYQEYKSGKEIQIPDNGKYGIKVVATDNLDNEQTFFIDPRDEGSAIIVDNDAPVWSVEANGTEVTDDNFEIYLTDDSEDFAITASADDGISNSSGIAYVKAEIFYGSQLLASYGEEGYADGKFSFNKSTILSALYNIDESSEFSDGEYSVKFSSADKAGNLAARTVKLDKDTVKPSLLVEGNPLTAQQEALLTLDVSCGCSGIKNVYVKAPGDDDFTVIEADDGAYQYLVNENGDYTFYVENNAGIKSEKTTVTVDKIDKNAPAVTVKATLEGKDYNSEFTGSKEPVVVALSTENTIGKSTFFYKLSTDTEWIPVTSDDNTVSLTADGKNTYEFKATSESGIDSTSSTKFTVCRDTVAPVVELITYSTPAWAGFLNDITFGAAFGEKIVVTVDASDECSGVSAVTLEAKNADDSVALSKTVEFDPAKSSASAEFEIPAQFRGKIEVTVADLVENSTDAAPEMIMSGIAGAESPEDYELIADTTAPEVYFGEEIENDGCYNGDVELEIYIKEANFFADDVMVSVIGENGTLIDTDNLTWTAVDGADSTYCAVIPVEDDDKYTATVNYADKSGNKTEEVPEITFTVDNTLPDVKVEYEDETVISEADGVKYYGEYRTATVTVTETNYIWSENDVVITAKDKDGNPAELPDVSENKWSENGNEHKLVIRYNADAEYTFDVSVTDKAGNKSAERATEKFVVDTAAPEIKSIKYSENIWKGFLEAATFGIFYNDKITVTVNAEDAMSGVSKIELIASSSDGSAEDVVYSKTFENPENEAEAEFTVPAQFRGQFEVVVTDRVEKAVSSTKGEILDEFSGEDEIKNYEFVADNVKPVISFGESITDGDFLTGAPELTVYIKEANLYGEDASVQITSEDSTSVPDTTDISWTESEGMNDTYETVIPFTADGAYEVKVNCTDKSGNKAEEKIIKFTVDNTKPVVTAVFTDDVPASAEKGGMKYYSQAKTAEVTVVEKNYNWTESDVVITAEDLEGNAVAIPDISEAKWTHNGDEHVLTINYTASAKYNFKVAVKDKAGNASDTKEQTFVVDTDKPEIESVTYSTVVWKEFINDIFLRVFFDDTVHVVVTASDKTSGVSAVEVKGILSEDASDIDSEYSNTVTFNSANNPATAEFDIPAQFRGRLSVKAVDIATNENSATDKQILNIVDEDGKAKDYEFIIDDKDASITFGSNITDKEIYTGTPELTVNIDEANFSPEDVTIEITSKDDNGGAGAVPSTSSLTWTAAEGKPDTHSTTIKFTEDGDYTVKTTYKDKSNNISENEITFTVDNTKPVVDVAYEDGEVVANEVDGYKYYTANRTATVTVVEHNFDWKKCEVTITAEDVNGNPVSKPSIVERSWTHEGNTHTLKIPYTTDAKYTFNINVKDKADNASAERETEKFVVDKVAPAIDSITYSTPVLKQFINDITFGIFFNDTIHVTVKTSDATAGVCKVELTGTLSEDASDVNSSFYKAETVDPASGSDTAEFDIPAQFRGQLSVKVTDLAKQTTESTDKDILKSVPQAGKASDYEIFADSKAPVITLGTEIVEGAYYSGTPELKIYVNEANFFGEDVKVEISAFDIMGKPSAKPATDKLTWTAEEGTADTYKTVIPFEADGDYTVKVNYTDKAGNKAEEKTVKFIVDNSAPVIKVTYDNNSSKSQVGDLKYYTAQRTATVEITERNFKWSKDDVQITAENFDDGEVTLPDISEGKWVNSGNVHKLVIPYVKDARYTVDISNTDQLGHTTTVDTEKFVVDTTDPVIDSITYNVPVWKGFINAVTFGVFFKDEMAVTVKASDVTSGIKKIDFTAELSDGVSSVNKAYSESKAFDTAQGSQTVTFTVPAQYRGKITVKVTDYATRTTTSTAAAVLKSFEQTTASYELVADNIKPEITLSNNINEGQFLTGKPELTVTVKEANFFGEDVSVAVTSVDDNGKNGSVPDTSKLSWKEVSGKADTYQAVIPFTADGDYSVKVNYTDKSGNTADEKAVSFTVDNTVPVITVTYDNNDVKNEANGFKYYTENRTATVKIVEHNYNWSDKDVVITAKDVNGKTLTAPDVAQGKWTHSGNEHTLVINYNSDAQYTFDVSTTDKAGNTPKPVDTEKFVVDTTDPLIDSITYNVPAWKGFINAATFGVFFKDEIDVTVNTSDITSGIRKIDFTAELSEGISSVNKAYSDSKTFDTAKETQTVTFTVPAQYRGKITVKVTDYATRTTTSTAETVLKSFEQTTDNYELVADNIVPEITLSDNIKSGEFYTGEPELTVTVTEANFFGEDVVVAITSVDDNEKSGTVPDTSKLTWKAVTGKADTYQTVIPFTADGDYSVKVNYTDKSGNKAAEKAVDFTLDNTAPTVTVTYDNDGVKNEANGIKYYTAERTATVKITEHNYKWNEDDVVITAKDVDGKVLETPDVSQSKWVHNGNDHTLTIKYNSDAEYTFDVTNTDKAGNMLETVPTEHFVVDTVNPELKSEDIVFEMVASNADFDTKNAEFETYKFFSNGKSDVTITATDITAGISGIEAYTVDTVTNARTNLPGIKYETGKSTAVYTFTLPDDFKGYVYARATDFSTRTSDGDAEDGFTKSIGAVVETLAKHNDTLSGKITAQREPNPNGFYNADLPIIINVKDSYSGISKLTYKVGSSDSVVVDFQNKGDVTYEWTSEVLTINAERNNNNHVVVTVSYVDNAGNPHKTQQVFDIEYKIDITKPVIKVDYNNNTAQNGKFFKADRIATVTITELNFSAKDVKFTITKDGKNYSEIIPAESSWRHSGEEHTVKIIYSSDGDYTFNISYTDLANNSNGPVQYGNSVAANAFTVDKTAPVITSITYDNNDSVNGNYFRSSRTATVTIREHNFTELKAPVTVTASDDGTPTAAPAASDWKYLGNDTYAAVVVFSKDALYGMDVACTDLAGNDAVPYAHQEFYVDNEDPVVSVKKIVPNSANKGDVAPVITVTDKNIDYSQISVELVGAKNGKANYKGSGVQSNNGYTYTFSNFAMKQSADDIYTLKVVAKDKAGRTNSFVTAFDAKGNPQKVSGNAFRFSVNRFGSAYNLDDSTRKINGKIIDNEQDVVMYEINADTLKDISVIIRKNNKKIELVEGKDYKIDVTGGNGSWYTYKYTIFKDNFADEAFYSVEVSSTDAAGNKSVNTLDSKMNDVAFDIDKNKPEINITNIKKNETKMAQSYDVVIYVSDNIKLSDVVLMLDGEKVDGNFDGEKYTITIDAATTLKESRHSLTIKAVDMVGNETQVGVAPFYVTTSKFISFLANTKMVIAAAAGVILLALLLIFFILFKRRKDDDEEEEEMI